MQRTWSARFLLNEAIRRFVVGLVFIPCWLMLAAVMFCVWIGWIIGCGLQIVTLGRKMRRVASYDLSELAVVRRPPGPTRTLRLPPPRKAPILLPKRSRRGWLVGPSVEELQNLLAGVTRHAWPKAKVLTALEALGATRAWSQPMAPNADDRIVLRQPRLAAAREQVHLHYRKDNGPLTQWIATSAFISVYFNAEGRLVHADAMRPRLRLC